MPQNKSCDIETNEDYLIDCTERVSVPSRKERRKNKHKQDKDEDVFVEINAPINAPTYTPPNAGLINYLWHLVFG